MLCPACKKNPAIQDPTYGVTHCASCRANKVDIGRPEFYIQTQKDRVQEGRDKFEKDMIPPHWGKDNKANPEFVKAYPTQATEYFTEEELVKV